MRSHFHLLLYRCVTGGVITEYKSVTSYFYLLCGSARLRSQHITCPKEQSVSQIVAETEVLTTTPFTYT